MDSGEWPLRFAFFRTPLSDDQVLLCSQDTPLYTREIWKYLSQVTVLFETMEESKSQTPLSRIHTPLSTIHTSCSSD